LEKRGSKTNWSTPYVDEPDFKKSNKIAELRKSDKGSDRTVRKIIIKNKTPMETKRQSVFMQMHNGLRPGEGSFNVGLQKLFYLADNRNRRKLVNAFPEFFGNEVPEFGITNTKLQDR
jgi:hypothetical protein